MPERQDQRRLGQILVERGVISQAQLEAALKEQKLSDRFIGEILVARGVASEDVIAMTLSEQLGFAYVDLSTIIIESKAIELIPVDLCIKHKVIPLFLTHNILTIAMANTLDINAVDKLQAVSKLRVRPVFAGVMAIRTAIEKEYRGGQLKGEAEPSATLFSPLEEKEEQALQGPGEAGADKLNAEAVDITSLKEVASLAPVIDMVNNIITKAVEMGASDIHLEPKREKLDCRYRIDGVLYSVSEIPLAQLPVVISRIKIMANMDIAEKRLPQDGRIRIFVTNRDVDLRISTFPTIHGENVVIRILDRSAGMLRLKQLGFSDEPLKQFTNLIHRPYGIILVTGPTGSGKTTTLYAALNEINSVEKNMITLEDPVEYEIPNVRQSQINIKAGLTFASGLRSIVRQDPDIIMIGEIRDKETADIAIHAALTGHLVFSTLHTNDAPSAATRLIDMGVEPFLVSSSIICILAQRLMRTLCNSCKEGYNPSRELLSSLRGVPRSGATKQSQTFYRETGCKRCKNRGYAGRTGIFELMVINDDLREHITRKSSAVTIRQAAVKGGMQTLRDAGLEKVISGITSVAEVLRVTEEV
ncbi:MAG: Flp pilus assembly complex ATPase component TadA [Candidatus Omnitrophica bacterium]|nr:Flp pilus assembly complex ATPase component TadA [Candidatus Omnitrophota bacterium]